MNRDRFVHQNEPTWQRTEELLGRLESRRRFEHELAELPELYRRCCHHLALARQRHYDTPLEERLNRIALRGYHQLYRQRRFSPAAVLRFVAVGFPRRVRAHASLFWLATALFYGPGIAMGLLVLDDPDSIYSFLSAAPCCSPSAWWWRARWRGRADVLKAVDRLSRTWLAFFILPCSADSSPR